MLKKKSIPTEEMNWHVTFTWRYSDCELLSFFQFFNQMNQAFTEVNIDAQKPTKR